MNRIKILSVLVAILFSFNIISPAFAELNSYKQNSEDIGILKTEENNNTSTPDENNVPSLKFSITNAKIQSYYLFKDKNGKDKCYAVVSDGRQTVYAEISVVLGKKIADGSIKEKDISITINGVEPKVEDGKYVISSSNVETKVKATLKDNNIIVYDSKNDKIESITSAGLTDKEKNKLISNYNKDQNITKLKNETEKIQINKIKTKANWNWLNNTQKKAVEVAINNFKKRRTTESFNYAANLIKNYVKQNKANAKAVYKKDKNGNIIFYNNKGHKVGTIKADNWKYLSKKQRKAVVNRFKKYGKNQRNAKSFKAAQKLATEYNYQKDTVIRRYTKKGYNALTKLASTLKLSFKVVVKTFLTMGVTPKQMKKVSSLLLTLIKRKVDFINCASNAAANFLGIKRPLAALMDLAADISINVNRFIKEFKNEKSLIGTYPDASAKVLQQKGYKNATDHWERSNNIMNFKKGTKFMLTMDGYNAKGKYNGGHIIYVERGAKGTFIVSDNLTNSGKKITYSAKEFKKFLQGKTATGKKTNGKTIKVYNSYDTTDGKLKYKRIDFDGEIDKKYKQENSGWAWIVS